jgi:hypothetical protein
MESPLSDLPIIVPEVNVLSISTPLVVIEVLARGYEDLVVGLEVHYVSCIVIGMEQGFNF